MIHLNIDVKTGESCISKKRGEGQIHKNTGIIKKIERFTPRKFILSAGHVTANLEISKLITPLYSYLTTSEELLVFLAGLFSEEYACLSTTGNSNTVIDQQKISQEIQNQLTKNSATVASSLIETLNVRINVFSSIFDPELSIRKPAPAMAIDFILPLELRTTNQINVELRKTFHNGESLEHLLLKEPMSLEMPDDCFLEGQRFKRSWMGKCLLEVKSPGKILALLEQRMNEKDQQSKGPPRPLVIDPSENSAMIIRRSQIEPSLEIHVIQEVLAWNTYRENKNLIWFANGGKQLDPKMGSKYDL
uniref:Uncharacterized protein n=1 Tax=Romanomermis culicivorax TaxID=13658 RepID=A0A915KRT8_ROMCU